MAKREGKLNQALLEGHEEIAEWKGAVGIRRPFCGGEPDLLFLDKAGGMLYVVEGVRGDRLREDELLQLAGYAAWFRGATPALLKLACDRALDPERKCGRQNAKHLDKHKEELPDGALAKLLARKSWTVVPVLAVYLESEKVPKLLDDGGLKKRCEELGIGDLKVLLIGPGQKAQLRPVEQR
jgi:hypothetical protein